MGIEIKKKAGQIKKKRKWAIEVVMMMVIIKTQWLGQK